MNTQYIDLYLCVVDYYLCNDLNWYNYVLIWVVTSVAQVVLGTNDHYRCGSILAQGR